MRVPIVICPCGEDVALLSCRHFTTIDVDDMDTCRREHPHTVGIWVDFKDGGPKNWNISRQGQAQQRGGVAVQV